MTVVINGTSGITDVNGTAAAPAITGTDTDTGVFFGTNTVSLSTGGTERLQIDSSGNLGLGVTPSAWTTYTNVLQTPGLALATNGTAAVLGANWYYDGQNRYKTNGYSTLYIQSAGTHSWFTAASGTAGNTLSSLTQAMTLDASGNLGVGTSSPSDVITLAGGASGSYGVTINNSKVGGGTKAIFQYDADNGIAVVGGNTTNGLAFKTLTGGSLTEKARIDSSGNLLVGTTNAYGGGRRLVVEGSVTVASYFHNIRNNSGDYAMIMALGGSNTNNTSSYYLLCDTDNVGVRMAVFGNGNIQNINNSYGAYSDIKLKENITDATPKLADLMRVQIRNYNLIGEEAKQIGVVAQELEQVFPSMIEESPDYENVTTTDEDGNEQTERVLTGTTTKSVKYSVFVPMLIKAIQEQQAIITQLQADVAALKGNA